jgi:hypothetical protein
LQLTKPKLFQHLRAERAFSIGICHGNVKSLSACLSTAYESRHCVESNLNKVEEEKRQFELLVATAVIMCFSSLTMNCQSASLQTPQPLR